MSLTSKLAELLVKDRHRENIAFIYGMHKAAEEYGVEFEKIASLRNSVKPSKLNTAARGVDFTSGSHTPKRKTKSPGVPVKEQKQIKQKARSAQSANDRFNSKNVKLTGGSSPEEVVSQGRMALNTQGVRIGNKAVTTPEGLRVKSAPQPTAAPTSKPTAAATPAPAVPSRGRRFMNTMRTAFGSKNNARNQYQNVLNQNASARSQLRTVTRNAKNSGKVPQNANPDVWLTNSQGQRRRATDAFKDRANTAKTTLDNRLQEINKARLQAAGYGLAGTAAAGGAYGLWDQKKNIAGGIGKGMNYMLNGASNMVNGAPGSGKGYYGNPNAVVTPSMFAR